MPVYDLAAGRERNKRWRQAQPQKYLWNHARQRAKRKGVPFTIKPADIPLPTHCPVFGFELAYSTVPRSQRDRSASVHRMVPSLGYVPGNILVVSFRANFLLGDGKLEELQAVCRWLGTVDIYLNKLRAG